jgi:hypothetical protein
MRNDTQVRRTCLFTVRLWLEPLDDNHAEIRGEARHVSSGERRFVRDRAGLEAFFAEKLGESHNVSIRIILGADWFKG